jgi:hypothetical protein
MTKMAEPQSPAKKYSGGRCIKPGPLASETKGSQETNLKSKADFIAVREDAAKASR